MALPQKLCRGCATALPSVLASRMGYALSAIGPDDFGLSPLMIDPLAKSEIESRAQSIKLNPYGRASPSAKPTQAAKPQAHARATFEAKPSGMFAVG